MPESWRTRLTLPTHWCAVEFISDLHLQSSEAATWQAWLTYLKQVAQDDGVDALFILGDLFEVWVGDDVLDAAGHANNAHGTPLDAQFEHRSAAALRQLAQVKPVYFMHGNRDFLLAERFAEASGMTLLADPCVLQFEAHAGAAGLLLSHGDAWCLADTAYQAFRQQVRSPAWQAAFLAQPLSKRQADARAMREHSEARKDRQRQTQTMSDWADVDSAAALASLQAHQAQCLIHGHTHRPARHDLGQGFSREVLSDWDLSSTPPRAEVLRVHLTAPPPNAESSATNPRFRAERIAYHSSP
jgi:UDP-2,3-diacylglucosamine hydrolase